MTRLEAMAIYCSLNSKASGVISKIIAWDELTTIKENAKKLKMSKESAFCLAKKYGLQYRRSYKTRTPTLHAPQEQSI